MSIIAIVNHCTLVSQADVEDYAAAQQIQIGRDFSRYYSFATVVLLGPGQKLPPGAWSLLLCDTDNDVPGALAWHELGGGDLPDAIVPVGLSITAGDHWQSSASHEALEMLADPWCVNQAEVMYKGKPASVDWEVCDPVENDEYPIIVPNGHRIPMSNFVLPYWFLPAIKGPIKAYYDFMGQLSGPFPAMSPGGYFVYSTQLGHYGQVFGTAVEPHQRTPGPFCRRSRRAFVRTARIATKHP